MPLVPRPSFIPLPEPLGLDWALEHELEVLAGELLPPVEQASDAAGLELATLSPEAEAGTAAADSLGRDLALGVEELAAMQAEAASDTLEAEILQAATIDAELAAAANETATAVEGAVPEAAPPAEPSPPVGEEQLPPPAPPHVEPPIIPTTYVATVEEPPIIMGPGTLM